jgi:PAP2 superfamily
MCKKICPISKKNRPYQPEVLTKAAENMSILKINDLALQLVANDFSKTAPPPANSPTNGGPTKTSRALAIIHLAAHDAYAKVTGKLTPQLPNLPDKPSGIGSDEDTGITALLGAGLRAAVQLYPDQAQFIEREAAKIFAPVGNPMVFAPVGSPIALRFGEQVADAWLAERSNDGSASPQEDKFYDPSPGRHRPDPLKPNETTLGRTWGIVKPFTLKNGVETDAFLSPPPPLNSQQYADSFNQVLDCGKGIIALSSDPDLHKKAQIGIFWGYDGSIKLGTPPRLYNQVVRAIGEFKALPHCQQVKLLTAINVAMADAGIAAWHWKYEYDFWRPVVGIREANTGFGPTGMGDGNSIRKSGDPFWLPLGLPRNNLSTPSFGVGGSNLTPNFPAYPSGHSTFGSACFEVVATLLCKKPEEISVTFVSDEFDGVTTDNTGATRPKWSQTFTLREAIDQNSISRIYLGVHWDFDASGGAIVGKAVAEKAVEAFR